MPRVGGKKLVVIGNSSVLVINSKEDIVETLVKRKIILNQIYNNILKNLLKIK